MFDGVGVALFGALAIMLAYLLFRPLELWRPVEHWSERRPVRTDVVYTLVHKLGVVPALLFVLLTPIGAMIDGYLRFRATSRRPWNSCCRRYAIGPSRRSSLISCCSTSANTGATGFSTACRGGGPCTACTMTSAR